jgi:hypothetical protein
MRLDLEGIMGRLGSAPNDEKQKGIKETSNFFIKGWMH